MNDPQNQRTRTTMNPHEMKAVIKLKAAEKSSVLTAGNSIANKADIILNNEDGEFYGHDGTQWKCLSCGGGGEVSLSDACEAAEHETLVANGVGPDLSVKGLVEGEGITLTAADNCVTISSSGGGDYSCATVAMAQPQVVPENSDEVVINLQAILAEVHSTGFEVTLAAPVVSLPPGVWKTDLSILLSWDVTSPPSSPVTTVTFDALAYIVPVPLITEVLDTSVAGSKLVICSFPADLTTLPPPPDNTIAFRISTSAGAPDITINPGCVVNYQLLSATA